MKKITFSNNKGLNLIASLWPASSDAIVIMAHGSGSNRYARGLFEKIAVALQAENYNVFSFDFSGHGESDDAIFNVAHAIDDLQAAINYAKKQNYKRIAFFGHSLGALACLEAAGPDIRTMVLLGALTGPVDWKWKENYTPEQLQHIYTHGYISSPVNDGLRETVKTDVRIFDEILAINQKQLLTNVQYPILIIHGDADQGEKDLLPFSQQAMSFLPAGSELTVIHGAGHSFSEQTTDVINLTLQWYRNHFKI